MKHTPTFPQSVRFASELETAKWLRAVAKERGHKYSLEIAHEIWAEYSESMCAGWLCADSENPKAEAWRAITLWEKNHKSP